MLIRIFKTWFTDTILAIHEQILNLRENLVMSKSILMPKILENSFKSDHAQTHKKSVYIG